MFNVIQMAILASKHKSKHLLPLDNNFKILNLNGLRLSIKKVKFVKIPFNFQATRLKMLWDKVDANKNKILPATAKGQHSYGSCARWMAR